MGGCRMSDGESLARARSEAMTPDEARERGRVVAAALRADARCFQQEAALKAGILPARYWRLLDGDSPTCEAFQAEVLPAVYEQARAEEQRAEGDIGSAENGSSAWGNWHRWRLEKRYRKLYGDLAQKVELTGKDGGPVEQDVTVTAAVVVLPAKDPLPDDDE
jgi:hypothetical protein